MKIFRGTVFGILVCVLAASDFFQTNGFQCGSDEFTCANRDCRPKDWRCDGDNDCGDNSDEKNCPAVKCDVTMYFQCHDNNHCIPQRWVCDFDPDCKDGSDESISCANRTCSPTEFSCGNGRCISSNWICDHDRDCDDGSDEQGCGNKTCSGDEFTCANGKCIQRSWHCDQDDDCGDGSDEKNCPLKTCKPQEFTCSSGRCIRGSWKCDGDLDCHDGSDEVGCPDTPSPARPCKITEFQCDNGQCVHKSWLCDGEQDCNDGSDEKSCNVSSCQPDKFTCTNGRCIEPHKQCDGKDDCLDSSDELDCPQPSQKPCKNGEFQCGTSDQCIPESRVCDARKDCSDGEDEVMQCGIDECIDHNGYCQQICNDTKTSYFCSCRPGFEVDKEDKKLCQDTNECLIPGSCSQVCINTKGSFKCICREGYFMEPDRRTCKALGPEGFLVFANRHDIRRILLDASDYREVIPGQKGAIALDFDIDTGLIFWTDVIEENIKRSSMGEEPKVEVLVSVNLHTPDGIAVDWINKKLYWTDTGTDLIEVSDLNGKNRLVLISLGVEEPRAIVVHPASGYMFWTDWGESAKIEKCGMNGDPETRHVLISTNILWPNALTVDYTVDRIWWADAKLHTIESADLNGRHRQVILSENIKHPFALTVFHNYMYWTDWDTNSIHKANKFTGKEFSLLAENLYSPMDLHVFHRQRQPAGVNPCRPPSMIGGCSHICLLAPRHVYPDGFSCHCPPGLKLLYDHKTCNTTDAFKCKDTFCLHGGTCIPGKEYQELPKCQCPSGYTGNRCQTTPFVPEEVDTPSPKPSNTPKTQVAASKEDVGTTVGISIGVVLFISLVGLLVGWFVFRRIQRSNRRSMNFDNPVYRKTTESISSLDKISIHVRHSYGKCQSLLNSFGNEVEVSNC